MKNVIAIDGPSGAGKSTVAKLLSKELGFDYLDTGALYRAVALGLTKGGIDENASDDGIAAALEDIRVEFRDNRVLLNGTDVSHDIRSPEASHFASVFSARRPVRAYLLGIQRDAAMHADLVAEGRDMTTVVFPEACAKFYLDASVGERTRRRTLELSSRGFEADEDRIRLDITERDIRDSRRALAPLRKADDAHFIDSTGLAVEEVFEKIIGIIREDAKDRPE
ncbi:MAG: (d)CMP kinase [Nitrospirae bacterium]|nr:(d)CMP kinase [Nitrospirota bacterium]